MTKVFEPIYQEGQRLAEPCFFPLDIADNSFSAWREFRILIDFYRSRRHLEAKKTGVFSPKFRQKSHISGERFLTFCDQHDGTDICLINPFPQWRYFAYNVWMQGESYHPGLIQCAQNLLDAAGVPLNIRTSGRHGPTLMAYSNFWVANNDFWERYVGGVLEPIAAFLEENPTHPAALAALTNTYHSTQAPFLPFITERLLSTFLADNTNINIAAYPFDDVDQHCLNDIQRAMVACMRPTVDAADEFGVFDPHLIHHLQYICDREAALTKAHFEHHPHPHTGLTVERV
jgi:hypothetical protein